MQFHSNRERCAHTSARERASTLCALRFYSNARAGASALTSALAWRVYLHNLSWCAVHARVREYILAATN